MKKQMQKHALSIAAAVTMLLGGGMQLYAADKIADTVYHNGKIYTVTETAAEAREGNDARTVDVVATLNGKIIFAGSKADAESKGFLSVANVNKIVDLRGKTMLPGFVDGHGHFPQQGESDLYKVNLNSPLLDGTVNSMDKLIEALANKAKVTPPGQPIVGDNYDDTQLLEQVHPTRYDLDKASTEHPILVRHISGHMSVANSAALDLYGIDENNQTEGLVKDKDGKPTGLLLEGDAMALVPLKVKSNPLQNVSRADHGCLGGILGVLAALGASRLFCTLMNVPFVFDPGINLLAFTVSALTGVVFGFFPARRAAKLDPIEAVRHE